MRFGIELPLLNVGNPKWPARLRGGPMIQTVDEDKYSFNMRVSAEAIAALDQDHSRWNAHLVRRRLTSGFNQLAIAPPARPCRRPRRKWPTRELHRPPMHSAILRLRKPSGTVRANVTRLTGAAHRPALWPHNQSVFVSSAAFGELCPQRMPRLHTHEHSVILLLLLHLVIPEGK
jgi:hypothetical protein